MSFLDQIQRTASEVLRGGKRQTKRAQLEVQNRQVERKINKEYARIGRTLYPLLAGGEISTNNIEVEAAVKAVTELQADMERRQGEIDQVLRSDDDGPGESKLTGAAPEAEKQTES